MTKYDQPMQSRRDLLQAAAGALASAWVPASASEPPPETKRIRLLRYPVDVACLSPMWIAAELLRAEGFDDVQYIATNPDVQFDSIVAGRVDLIQSDIFSFLPELDRGRPLVALGGIHGGCYELFARPGLRTIRELKGKTIVAANVGRRSFVAAMLAHVGLDPHKDVTFLESWDGVKLLAEGKVDAMLGFPPEPQLMRANKIGVSVVNTATDRPWSQYFCCMALGNRAFVAKIPLPPSARCAPSSRRRNSAPPSPSVSRAPWLIAAFTRTTSSRYRRCVRSRTSVGASTTLLTACASMRCACMRRVLSNRTRRSCSPRGPTGGSSSS